MGLAKTTQAIFGKNLTVMMGYQAVVRSDFREVFEVTSFNAFSPTRAAVDVTYYNTSNYRDTIQGLYDNAEITIVGNYAISDHRAQSPEDERIVFAKLWEWFQDTDDLYTEPLDVMIQYPRYVPTDLAGFHLFKAYITTCELDAPLDSALSYTCTLTTTGRITWATSGQPPGTVLSDATNSVNQYKDHKNKIILPKVPTKN